MSGAGFAVPARPEEQKRCHYRVEREMKKKMKSGRREREIKENPKAEKKKRSVSAVICTRSSVTNPLILFLYQNIAPPASRTSSSRRSTGITMEAVPDTDTNTKTHQVKLRGKKTLSFIIERSWVRTGILSEDKISHGK